MPSLRYFCILFTDIFSPDKDKTAYFEKVAVTKEKPGYRWGHPGDAIL